ncbi:MAG TPA: RNA-binding protein [Candidatus Acidoferrum sp.]|jgi:RNA recognition motif-containing protein
MKNLFVGNMSFQTTESELTELFKPFGQITRVRVVMDRETGRARGFAFVEMPNDEEASKAIAALDGAAVGGRNIKVNEARPKEAGGFRPGGGGGNRPYGGGGGGRPGGGGGRPSGGGGGRGRDKERFSNEDYREAARQPREPRW